MIIAPHTVLDFWFKESGPKKWYRKSDAFDADIRARYEEVALEFAATLRRNGRHKWEDNSDSTLALIVILDQFSRNMYRDTKAAFAFDDLALAVAKRAVDRGDDLKISQDRRAFMYMPYMHSEVLADQDECVRLMDMRLNSQSSLHHAKEHRKLIVKYKRFPHRNVILGRQNTEEERRFLDSGGYSP